MMPKFKIAVEDYADTFVNSAEIIAALLPKAMETELVPNTDAGMVGRAAVLSNADVAVFTYVIIRAWVLQSGMRRDHQARFLFRIDASVARGLMFTNADVDSLELQAFWHAANVKVNRNFKIQFAASACFLDRLRGGGLHGVDADRAIPLAVVFANLARLFQDQHREFCRGNRLD